MKSSGRTGGVAYAVVTISGPEINIDPGLGKRNAIGRALEEARACPDSQVFITWQRGSEHGYLNPDGSHATTGEAWKGNGK